MSTLRIEQYASMGLDNKGLLQMPALPPCAAAITVTSSGTSAASAALSPSARFLRVRATGTPPVAFRLDSVARAGGDPIAVATDAMVADGEVAFFAIDPSLTGRSDLKVAVIDAA